MCTTLTTLAHASHCRHIARCEHGTMHTTWDIATLRLREADFLVLARFLAAHAEDQRAMLQEGWCSLDRDARGNRRLWIGQSGLVIAATDFALFTALVETAYDLLVDRTPLHAGVLRCPIMMVQPTAFRPN